MFVIVNDLIIQIVDVIVVDFVVVCYGVSVKVVIQSVVLCVVGDVVVQGIFGQVYVGVVIYEVFDILWDCVGYVVVGIDEMQCIDIVICFFDN